MARRSATGAIRRAGIALALASGWLAAAPATGQVLDRAYVANRGGASVSVVNTSTGATVATIPFESNPYDVVAARGEVFVSLPASNRIAVIDPRLLREVRSISVPGAPRDLDWTLIEPLLVIATDDGIRTFDWAAGVLGPAIPAGPGSSKAIAAGRTSADFRRVFVAACDGGPALRVVDLDANAVTATLATRSGPCAVAAASDRLYVANTDDDTVSVFGPPGLDLRATVPVADRPIGFVLGGHRVVSTSGVLTILDPHTDAVVEARPLPGAPTAALDEGTDRLLVADAQNRLFVLATDGSLQRTIGVGAQPGAIVLGTNNPPEAFTLSTDSVWPDQPTADPALSLDGRFAAFSSAATNLVTADTNGLPDIFVRDRLLRRTTRVSVSSTGAQAEGGGTVMAGSRSYAGSYRPWLSETGRYVLFASLAVNLVPGDANGGEDLFLHDRDVDADGLFDEPGQIATRRITVQSDGSEATCRVAPQPGGPSDPIRRLRDPAHRRPSERGRPAGPVRHRARVRSGGRQRRLRRLRPRRRRGTVPTLSARCWRYVVRQAPIVSGSDLRDARQGVDEYNGPAVSFTLNREAARRFGDFTANHINRALATVRDGRVAAVATIQSRIDDHGQIVGISREQTLEQVVNLRTGALPADLEYVEERTIGASLGASSIRSGVRASIGGLVLVAIFVLGYYRRAGLNALASIVLNLLVLLALIALVPVTLTLPGIAGLILTIGMGVDSNVLIFERIKEELGGGRDSPTAVRAGFDRVWITIVDTHVTSLIAAAILFQYGTTAIQGFATTLTLGLMANVFTAVFVSKTLFEFAHSRRRPVPGALFAPVIPVRSRGFGFTRWGLRAWLLSLVIIGAGALGLAVKGMPLGIVFAGGTLVLAEFAGPGTTADRVREAVAALPGDEIVQQYGPADERRFLIRRPVAEGTVLETGVRQVTRALEEADLPDFQIVERELVSASIGGDLQRRGICAVAGSIAAITAYIGIRFRLSFAIGAMAAAFHDLLVTVACLALAGYDLSLNVTAALLTVIGYSVNDTIVVFDRVRENVRLAAGQSLAAVVDLSVRQTLTRTMVTAGTTLLAVLALYLFGGQALRGFAFTMLVGIVSGTWSTIFVASPIATHLNRRIRAGSGAGHAVVRNERR